MRVPDCWALMRPTRLLALLVALCVPRSQCDLGSIPRSSSPQVAAPGGSEPSKNEGRWGLDAPSARDLLHNKKRLHMNGVFCRGDPQRARAGRICKLPPHVFRWRERSTRAQRRANLRSILLKRELPEREFILSGREDLNLRPLAPHASALAGLRHAPN